MKKLLVIAVMLALLACAKEKITQAGAVEEGPEAQEAPAAPAVPASGNARKKYSCAALQSGTFKYTDNAGDEVTVSFEGDACTEEHKGGFITLSKIKWTGECSYESTFIMTTRPGTALKPGMVMRVDIDRVDGNDFYFTATMDTKSYRGKFTKM